MPNTKLAQLSCVNVCKTDLKWVLISNNINVIMAATEYVTKREAKGFASCAVDLEEM